MPSATSSADLPGENTKVSGLIDENKRLRYRILQLEKRESQFTADLDKLQVTITVVRLMLTMSRRWNIKI